MWSTCKLWISSKRSRTRDLANPHHTAPLLPPHGAQNHKTPRENATNTEGKGERGSLTFVQLRLAPSPPESEQNNNNKKKELLVADVIQVLT